MKPTLEDYFKDIPIDDRAVCEDNIFLHHDLFTNMINEAVCIIDFQNRNFYDVTDHGFFLCGYSRSEAKSMGYQFFDEIIHPEDLFLWVEMHNKTLKYLHEQDFGAEEVLYFLCTIRIKSSFQFRKTPYYMMSYVRLRPVFVNHKLKYGLCFFTASAVKTSGNLCVYLRGERIYREYSFTIKKWTDRNMLKLSQREREILMLTQQGLNREETANTLCVSDKTIKNTINRLLKKCDTKRITQAENYARIHRLIHYNRTVRPKSFKGKRANRD